MSTLQSLLFLIAQWWRSPLSTHSSSRLCPSPLLRPPRESGNGPVHATCNSCRKKLCLLPRTTRYVLPLRLFPWKDSRSKHLPTPSSPDHCAMKASSEEPLLLILRSVFLLISR